MLTKKDLMAIGKVFDSRFDIRIKSALTEFFETLILPYFEHNEKDHAEIKATLKVHDKRFDDHDKRFDTQDKELDSIYRKLEKNEDDHEEIFRQLHDIDQHIGKQAKRIDHLEAITSV